MAWFKDGASRIHYEDVGDDSDVALLLPGLTDGIDAHAPLRAALRNGGLRVIAADLPGSGKSLPQPRAYTATYLEEDARSFMALLRHLEVETAHLIGFSDGGEVALQMAVLSPGQARSVVTWGSAGQINDPGGQLRDSLFNVVDNPIPQLRDFSAYLIAAYGDEAARATTQSAARAMTDIVETRGGDLILSRAKQISCPALLIAGEHDPFAPPPLVAQLAARIPNASLLGVEGAGHDIHRSHGEWLSTTIIDWLKDHGRGYDSSPPQLRSNENSRT